MNMVHPGYAAPSPQQTPYEVGRYGKVVTAMLALSAVSGAARVVVGLTGRPEGQLTGVTVALFWATIPLFLTWFYRVRKNAGMWGPQRRSQGWTIGAWFTPVVNLWFPVQIMRDVWRVSAGERGEQTAAVRLIAAWWTCWVLAWVTGYRNKTVHMIGPDGSMIQSRDFGLYADSTLASALCLAVAAVLLAQVVARITAMQTARGGA